mmetsp:Transcript_29865/g.91454  ORF Transcript_29865/g.91454 Transcript_29865/m.91454 type:complete len:205 (+) Transcript_29865:1028-1642(+)
MPKPSSPSIDELLSSAFVNADVCCCCWSDDEFVAGMMRRRRNENAPPSLEKEDDGEGEDAGTVPQPSGPEVLSRAARAELSSTTRRTWKLTWQTMKLETLKSVAIRLKGTSAWMEPSIHETPSTSKGATTPWRSLASNRCGRRIPGRAQEAATAEANVTWGVVMWFIKSRWTESAWPSARWAETEMQRTLPVFSWASWKVTSPQ